MSQIEQEIGHNIDQGRECAFWIKKGAEGGLKGMEKIVVMLWHEHSLQYQPGIGYLQIQHPSPMDRFLDRLIGGSRSVPRLVRVIPI